MTRAEETLLAAAERSPAPPADFLAEVRRAGRERFAALGLPTTRLEEWRYTSLSSLSGLSFEPADGGAPVDAGAISRVAGPALGHRLVFVNGRYRPELSSVGGLPGGAFAGSLAAAPALALAEARLGRLAQPQASALAALNAAALADGALVHLPAGTVVPEPIEILHLTLGGGAPVASHPRNLIVAGPGSQATVVESYRGLGDGPALTNAVTEVELAAEARLEHHQVQEQPLGAWQLGLLAARQERGSRFATQSAAFGAALSRNEVRAVLAGEGGEAHLSGLYMVGGRQLVDNHSVVEHAAPGCLSREVFKGVLDGQSRAVFAGRVRVLEGAVKTDAHQMNANLLLSAEAEVDAMPQLEIYADDVKCGHGGTVGQLDEDALFYLRSRGIDREQARGLLIFAFAEEMVRRVGPAALRNRLARRVAAVLPGGERLLEAA
jgi:Fe-S cluster assembly protein SufD